LLNRWDVHHTCVEVFSDAFTFPRACGKNARFGASQFSFRPAAQKVFTALSSFGYDGTPLESNGSRVGVDGVAPAEPAPNAHGLVPV
jgi:hypothetical protein